jgi:hypothetical protein
MIDFANIKIIDIPEGSVKQIEANGVVLWAKSEAYTNRIPYAIGTDGKPYNNGLGYKKGIRISTTAGDERNSSNGVSTGFIKTKAKDVVRIWEFAWGGGSANNAIILYNSNFAYLGSTTWNGTNSGTGAYSSIQLSPSSNYAGTNLKNATLTLIDNADIAYFRVCSFGNNGATLANPDYAIITVNEEIL